ncbi:MAG TPA: DNA ligase [Gammaproteobacteria bacterium]|nr:DNA ligase [Gammaproteobacteria bacterium]
MSSIYGRILACLALWLVIALISSASAQTSPSFKLATAYRDDIVLSDYLVSEKYDGIRARWDGQRLYTRGGNTLQAPAWFVRDFGARPLDGELWLGRSQFEQLSSIVRRLTPDAEAWRAVRYMVFDLPMLQRPFVERYAALSDWVSHSSSPYLVLVEQAPVASRSALMQRLSEVVEAGGEGLMLQRRDAPYRGKRSTDLVKLKAWQDAEATVMAHLPGQGKYVGMLGALLVETPEGVQFRLGTGFSDVERDHPPPLGSVVTYKYTGLSRLGVPRFASFLRVRHLR